MKSTIQKSLYTLFLASYIFSASCFANENETPKENNETTSSSSKKKKGENLKKYLLLSLPLAAIAATYIFSKRSGTPNNNRGGQIPPSNNNENNPSNNNGGNQTPQGSNPSNNNKNKPSNNNGGSQNPQEDEYVKRVNEFLTQNDNNANKTDDNDKPLLYYLLKEFHKEAAEYLISKGADIDLTDDDSKPILYHLLEEGSEEATKYLIDKGADVNLALRSACRFCKKDMVITLIENYGADATITVAEKNTLLHVICDAELTKEQRNDAVEIIQFLKTKGVEINAKTNAFIPQVALYMACKNYYYDLAQELINQGADVNVKNDYLESNLLIATCQHGYKESNNIEDFKKTIDLLLSKGIEIDATNKEQKTALHMACKTQTKEKVEYLINKGAKDEADKFGDLPAHFASINREYGHAILTLLKEKSFNIKAKNNRDKTPEDIATNGKMTEDFLSVFK